MFRACLGYISTTALWLARDPEVSREKHLLHELLHKIWVVPPIEHSYVQELWHVQEPLIIQQRCLLLPCRPSRLHCDPAMMNQVLSKCSRRVTTGLYCDPVILHRPRPLAASKDRRVTIGLYSDPFMKGTQDPEMGDGSQQGSTVTLSYLIYLVP